MVPGCLAVYPWHLNRLHKRQFTLGRLVLHPAFDKPADTLFAAPLQPHQQRMVRLLYTPAFAQVVLDLAQQRCGHFCIGECAVGAAGAGQVVVVHQRAQLVAGGLWVQTA